MDLSDRVGLYRCLSCGKWSICEKDNHHPWCLSCMYDQFDWSGGYDDIPRVDAERIMAIDE